MQHKLLSIALTFCSLATATKPIQAKSNIFLKPQNLLNQNTHSETYPHQLFHISQKSDFDQWVEDATREFNEEMKEQRNNKIEYRRELADIQNSISNEKQLPLAIERIDKLIDKMVGNKNAVGEEIYIYQLGDAYYIKARILKELGRVNRNNKSFQDAIDNLKLAEQAYLLIKNDLTEEKEWALIGLRLAISSEDSQMKLEQKEKLERINKQLGEIETRISLVAKANKILSQNLNN